MRKYLEKARELFGPLPEGQEIYSVSSPRTRTVTDTDPAIVCWECGRFVQPGDPFREVQMRQAGSRSRGRSSRFVHVACFRGNHPRRRRSA